MPRTKQVHKSKQGLKYLDESDLFLRDFHQKAQLRLRTLEAEAKMSIVRYETFHSLKLSVLSEELKQLTLGEIFAWYEDQKENYDEVTSPVSGKTLYSAPESVKAMKTSKRATAMSDDGYVTENTVTGARTSQASRASKTKKITSEVKTRRITRSTSKNRISTLDEITQKTLTKQKENGLQSKVDKFKTPTNSRPLKNEFNCITPKIKPNTPVHVLRRPREGEMALSMQGSPLLVSAIDPDKRANINVPLGNGNILSLLPNDGLRMSHIPALDPETMEQLETLKGHIEKVISLK